MYDCAYYNNQTISKLLGILERTMEQICLGFTKKIDELSLILPEQV